MKALFVALLLAMAVSAQPPPPAHANDPPHVWRWWARHIKGYRVDRSHRWDPAGRVRGGVVEALPQVVEEARTRPLPPPDGLPPVRERMPEVPEATPVPLPTPGWPW